MASRSTAASAACRRGVRVRGRAPRRERGRAVALQSQTPASLRSPAYSRGLVVGAGAQISRQARAASASSPDSSALVA